MLHLTHVLWFCLFYLRTYNIYIYIYIWFYICNICVWFFFQPFYSIIFLYWIFSYLLVFFIMYIANYYFLPARYSLCVAFICYIYLMVYCIFLTYTTILCMYCNIMIIYYWLYVYNGFFGIVYKLYKCVLCSFDIDFIILDRFVYSGELLY